MIFERRLEKIKIIVIGYKYSLESDWIVWRWVDCVRLIVGPSWTGGSKEWLLSDMKITGDKPKDSNFLSIWKVLEAGNSFIIHKTTYNLLDFIKLENSNSNNLNAICSTIKMDQSFFFYLICDLYEMKWAIYNLAIISLTQNQAVFERSG